MSHKTRISRSKNKEFLKFRGHIYAYMSVLVAFENAFDGIYKSCGGFFP